ncbi:cutinase family protein [Leucobacter sp. UCMA 4100]|uniref:cutinase family protein n=1 Tax=Leucobacter sp. UCMA 4100 TaxID=2810534 RepID=UPI0022EAA718|nr:cutinase family protein [Leucobacter sp. UCMA 4100]MDA3146146.1 cutinase family protein [Leucobacter sp. UCMA 4100]
MPQPSTALPRTAIQPQLHRAQRQRTRAAALSLAGALAALIAGCSTPPTPEVSAEQLAEVAEDPTPAEAAEELDAEVDPEPVVDPIDCSASLVLTVRGTGEPSSRQLLSPVAKKITSERKGEVERVDLDYPADGNIKESATIGIRMLVDTLNQQADLCPDQHTVLLGYSQGALVVGEALQGPEGRLIGETVGVVDEEASERISAVVLYADPRFVGSDPFGEGDYSPEVSGLLARAEGSLDDYASRAKSFCVADDFICQSQRSLNEEGHVAYYSNGMQQDGAAFVLSVLPKAPNESKNGSTR